MKEMRQRIQDLGRRAIQVKQALDAAPARVAQVREVVAQARSQVQQLRREVQASVVSLQAGDGDRLAAILAEVVGNAESLESAGYHLAGVEYEIDPVQRVFLLLDRVEEVPAGHLATLQAAHATHAALHGLLSAIARAETLATALQLPDQEYWRLRVEVGPAPAVRLCWRSANETEAPPVQSAPPVIAQTPPPASILGEGSFFDRRPTISPPSAAGPSVTVVESSTPAKPSPGLGSGAVPEEVPSGGSVLDRFKKMPDLTRRGH